MDGTSWDKSSRILILYTKFLNGQILKKMSWQNSSESMKKAYKGIWRPSENSLTGRQ